MDEEEHPVKEVESRPDHVRTLALTLIVLVVVVIGAYFLNRLIDAPGDIADKVPELIDSGSAAMSRAGERAAEGLRKLAAAINTQNIKTEYSSSATTLAGTARLQVATIRQVELFERHDSSTLMGVRLPDVIVSARAPIEYTYYLDLTATWDFYLDDKRLYAIAPEIEFNQPAVDVSAIQYTVQKGSVIRNHAAAINALKQGITDESYKRARENIQIARESARRQAEWFVQRFIGQVYGVDSDFPVEVVFRDETPALAGENPVPME